MPTFEDWDREVRKEIRRTTRADIVDLEMELHHKTDRAIKVSATGDEEDAVWLPLSQIEMTRKRGSIVSITMPEWLAVDKGLV